MRSMPLRLLMGLFVALSGSLEGPPHLVREDGVPYTIDLGVYIVHFLSAEGRGARDFERSLFGFCRPHVFRV